ncbi:mitochondrial ribonuclease P catalytic subunit-like [Watersipora subatra]|uniref:mitochondrial ribonuclease P catalytic subunit-like n=1 Tax=Watersipora subatra TaxID=2589382 RepID=UPI00355C7B07
MEKTFIDQLLALYESAIIITSDQLVHIFEHAIKHYESEELSPQLIVDMLSFFLAQYDNNWIRQGVIPLLPTAAKRMGFHSQRVLCSCIVAYYSQEKFGEKIDKFVTRAYLDYVHDSEHRNVSLYQVTGLHSLMLEVVTRSSRWKDLVVKTLDYQKANPKMVTLLVKRALSDGDFDLAFELFEGSKENIKSSYYVKGLHSEPYNDALKQMLSHLPLSQVPRILSVLRDLELEISPESAQLLLEKWSELRKVAITKERDDQLAPEGVTTQLDHSGRCLNCSGQLDTDPPTSEELSTLKALFYDKAIVESGVYKIGDPKSLAMFFDWLERREPYDLVIDGLNTFHCHFRSHTRIGGNARRNMAQQVLDVTKSGARILVVIKSHAQKWIPEELLDKVDIYYIKNDEMDDVFTLYAALYSGSLCHLLSSDVFSEHVQILFKQPDKSIAYTFFRWQRMRTILRASDYLELRGVDRFTNLDKNGKEVSFSKPLETNIKPQLCQGRWHVPVRNELLSAGRPRFGYTQQWLCLPSLASSV